jgi:UDP-glucose 4-epimerase
VAGDVLQRALGKLGEVPSVIVHCAGGSSVAASIDQTAEDTKKTIESATEVLEFACATGPGTKIVMLSSAAVYGQASHFPIAENAPLAPISPYGRHKVIVEDLCRAYCRRYGLAVAILRFFSVYGPGLRKQLFWDACQKIAVQAAVFQGTGEERRDWLHISDAAELIRIAAAQASSDCLAINGGFGQSITVREALSMIARAIPNSSAPRFCGGPRPGDPIGYEADISRAKALGWRPKVAISDGIGEYVDWYRSLSQ